MTVFVRGSNSCESGVDGFFLPCLTIVYEGLVELYFGGLQSGESSIGVHLRVGLGGVAGGEEEHGKIDQHGTGMPLQKRRPGDGSDLDRKGRV
jgi:hypothetical protein